MSRATLSPAPAALGEGLGLALPQRHQRHLGGGEHPSDEDEDQRKSDIGQHVVHGWVTARSALPRAAGMATRTAARCHEPQSKPRPRRSTAGSGRARPAALWFSDVRRSAARRTHCRVRSRSRSPGDTNDHRVTVRETTGSDEEDHDPARRRPRADLLRRGRRRCPRRARPAGPAGRAQAARELRYDALLDEWVAVAAHRQTRTFLPPADQCPLCPSRPGRPTEIPAATTTWWCSRTGSRRSSRSVPPTRLGRRQPDADLFARRPGVGRCEVVCFTSDHDSSFAHAHRGPGTHGHRGLGRPHHRAVRAARRRAGRPASRTAARRSASPCTTRTARSTPTRSSRRAPRRCCTRRAPTRHVPRATSSTTWWPRSGARRVRVVAETEHWIGLRPVGRPLAGRGPLYPRRRVPDLPALTEAERDDFGPLYLRLLSGRRRPTSTSRSRTSPRGTRHRSATGRDLLALHLQLFSIRRAVGKLKYLAGSESAMGVWINDVRPEDIAAGSENC